MNKLATAKLKRLLTNLPRMVGQYSTVISVTQNRVQFSPPIQEILRPERSEISSRFQNSRVATIQ